MSIEKWIAMKTNAGEEASVSLWLLEKRFNLPSEIPELPHIADWAKGVCDRLGCKYMIHLPSDVVTFYPS
jgi:hypothetical protein